MMGTGRWICFLERRAGRVRVQVSPVCSRVNKPGSSSPCGMGVVNQDRYEESSYFEVGKETI